MNYRMTELQGAVALAQLGRLPGLIRARQVAADSLTRQLREIPGILTPPEQEGVVSSWWMYSFGIDEDLMGVRIEDFCDALMVEGVAVRREYLPEPLFECDALRAQRDLRREPIPLQRLPLRATPPARLPGVPGVQSPDDSLLEPQRPGAARFRYHRSCAQGG